MLTLLRGVHKSPPQGYKLLTLILFIKTFTTFLTVFLVDRISPLRDAAYFLNWSERPGKLRDFLAGQMASSLKHLLQADIAVHLVFSFCSGFAVWWLLRDRDLRGWKIWALIVLLFSPAVAIWGSCVSKEAISIVFACFFFRFFLDLYEKNKSLNLLWMMCFLVLYGIFRIHFVIGLMWMVMAFYLSEFLADRFSFKAVAITFYLLTLICVTIFWDQLWQPIEQFVMPIARKAYAIHVDARTNRLWVDFSTRWDFIKNLWWGIPFSIIGPLPTEALRRPSLWPLLFGGVVTLGVYITCIVSAGRRLCVSNFGSMFFWCGVVPSLVITCLAHYPLGILNAGAGIRYHTPISVQLGFAMLAFSAIRRVGVTNNNNNQIVAS